MRITSLSKLLFILTHDPGVLMRRKRYILVLSHMRSYSSLFCHILGSHSEIAGYSEMHQSYARPRDFMRLRCHVYFANNRQLYGRFVLDKILHNSYAIGEAVMNLDNVDVIFLLRPPEAAIASITRLGNQVDVARYRNPEWGLHYYTERLGQLERYASGMRRKALFLKAENLIEDTESVLEAVAGYLRLTRKLNESYSTFRYTGCRGYGDPGNLIRTGKIIRQQKKAGDSPDIAPEVLKSAQRAYSGCREVLLRHCISL